MNTAPSPTPALWQFLPADEGDSFQVVDANGIYICKVNRRRAGKPIAGENKANAALIVTAVNQHAALVAVAEAAERVFCAVAEECSTEKDYLKGLNQKLAEAFADLATIRKAAQSNATPEPIVIDFTVHHQGTIVLVMPMTEAAKEWLRKYCPANADHQYFGKSLACEPRYLEGLVHGITNDGLTVD